MVSDPDKKTHIAIIGPTAAGKSNLGLALAKALGGEIISCDSIAVYRGFNIGAAKPTHEERQAVRHHLIDIIDPHEAYDAQQFADDCGHCIADIRSRGKLPIIVGGTGMYLKAFWGDGWHSQRPSDPELRQQLSTWTNQKLMDYLQQTDPNRATQLHRNDRFRLLRAVELTQLLGGPMQHVSPEQTAKSHQGYVIQIELPKDMLWQRIGDRANLMVAEGLRAEVQGLLTQAAQQPDQTFKALGSIGYKEMRHGIETNASDAAVAEAIFVATRQFSKKQRTLFQKLPKDAIWAPYEPLEPMIRTIKESFAEDTRVQLPSPSNS